MDEINKQVKLAFRIVMSLIVTGFGIAVWFTSTNDQLKMVGLTLVSTVFGAWVSMSTKKA